jgi:hypothetical protein
MIMRIILKKKQPENCLNIIINQIVPAVLKGRKLITVLRQASHDIKDKISNIVDRAIATSRRP